MIDTTNLKLVKEAKLIDSPDYLEITHYGTKIFSHSKIYNLTTINYNCSKTSDKQIKYALELIGKTLDQCFNIHTGKKYNFSGDQC